MLDYELGEQPSRGRARMPTFHDQNILAFIVMEAMSLQAPLVKPWLALTRVFFWTFQEFFMRTYDKLIESIRARRESLGLRLTSGAGSNKSN